mmetsp:Transcript_11662/g.16879  ORF Transcript_11662/g.16879 Transcript_11662/m.16879 type:complete len:94 (+) Transcript_11662:25-306(+)
MCAPVCLSWKERNDSNTVTYAMLPTSSRSSREMTIESFNDEQCLIVASFQSSIHLIETADVAHQYSYAIFNPRRIDTLISSIFNSERMNMGSW